MDQLMLPGNLLDIISEKHLVMVINESIEKMDIKQLFSRYRDGGTSSNQYKCYNCDMYNYSEECTKSKYGRKILINKELLRMKKEATKILNSEKRSKIKKVAQN